MLRPGLHLHMTSASLDRRPLLERRIRWIVAATITYNVVEAGVALVAGRLASSSALIGFGLDSVVEVLSAAAVAWQFSAPDPHTRERTAMRAIALSFFGLAAFVTVDAVRTAAGRDRAGALHGRDRPGRGQPGGHAVPVLGRAPHRP